MHAEGQGKGRAVEGEVTEEGRKQREEEEKREEGESDFDFKKRKREKKGGDEVKEVIKETLRLPGFFQVRLLDVLLFLIFNWKLYKRNIT